MVLTARSFALVSFLARIRPWFETRIWKKSIIAASSHLRIRRRELGLYRSRSWNKMITQGRIIDKFDLYLSTFPSQYKVTITFTSYFVIFYCLSIACFLYDANCYANSWKNIYMKSYYLWGCISKQNSTFVGFVFFYDAVTL